MKNKGPLNKLKKAFLLAGILIMLMAGALYILI